MSVQVFSPTPLGSIIAYAGSDTRSLQSQGWLPCDGHLLENSDYPALFKLISTSNGGYDTGYFAVPDCRGLFLRGQDRGIGADPDAASRVAPTDYPIAGATGDNVGSYQTNVLASHTHTYSLSSSSYNVMDEAGGYTLQAKVSATPQTGDTGLSTENRPVNAYVNFLICHREAGDGGVEIPVGTIAPFAAPLDTESLSNAGWLLCDGSLLSSSDYNTLFAVIHTDYGGDPDTHQFCLPDLRGCFLRGVDDDRGLDPDASTRTAPQPDQPTPGHAGNAIGSFQSSAFADHTHGYPGWDNDDTHHSDGGLAGYCITNSPSGGTTGSAGASTETRPTNVYVYWLIKYE